MRFAHPHDPSPSRGPDPIVSGVHPQGIPFKLFGPGASIPGTIVNTLSGCGTTGIKVEGAPNIGGFIRTTVTLTTPTGLPVIGYDLGVATPQAFCGCQALHLFPIALWFATESAIDIPVHVGFAGMPIGIQAVEFFPTGGGGCANPPMNFTDGYQVTINS